MEIAPQTKAVVIGLTATPFTKGMGQIFSRLINASTIATSQNRAYWCRCGC